MESRSVSARRSLDRNPEAVAIGSLFLTLFAVTAWAILVAHVSYNPLSDLITADPLHVFALPVFLTQTVGFVLGALLYARARNVEIPFGRPTGNGLKVAATTLFAIPLLVALTGVVGNLLLDTSISAMNQSQYAPEAQLSFLAFTSFVLALFRGLGYGLLFFGVVHERLRDVTTPRHALVLTPVVVGFFWELHGEITSIFFDPWAMAHFAVLVVVGVGFGSSLGLLYRGTVRATVESLVRPSYVPVFVVGLLGVVGVVQGLVEFPTGILDVLRIVAFAIAAYGYERTRSIWVPILIVATFLAVVDLTAYLEAVLGIVAPP